MPGRTVVVTGAARGLGRAIAEAFGAAGDRVALVDVLEDTLDETVNALTGAGVRAAGFAADTTDPDQVGRLPQRVTESLSAPDILVNNAGTFSVIGPVWETDPALWFRDLNTNLYGTYLCCRAFSAGLVERGAGRIVNIVSSGGVGDPHAYSTGYACSKTGVMRLTEGLAAEARDHGVSVFAVGPPALDTRMTRFIVEDEGGRKWRPGFGRIFEEGRDHDPADIARFVVDLVSGDADALTGRFFDPRVPLADTLSNAGAIVEQDLWTLRITGRER